MKEETKKRCPMPEKTRLRVQIQNMRRIIEKKSRGVKPINAREWEVRARSPESTRAERIMVCPDEETALAEYQKYIKNKLQGLLKKLEAIDPKDPFLREEA